MSVCYLFKQFVLSAIYLRKGHNQTRYCVWCNGTNSCLSYSSVLNGNCSASAVYTCPSPSITSPGTNAGQNAANTNAGIIAGVIVAVVVCAAVIGVLLYLRATGKGPLYFEPPDLDALPTFQNPLYQEYSPSQENPLYEAPPDK